CTSSHEGKSTSDSVVSVSQALASDVSACACDCSLWTQSANSISPSPYSSLNFLTSLDAASSNGHSGQSSNFARIVLYSEQILFLMVVFSSAGISAASTPRPPAAAATPRGTICSLPLITSAKPSLYAPRFSASCSGSRYRNARETHAISTLSPSVHISNTRLSAPAPSHGVSRSATGRSVLPITVATMGSSSVACAPSGRSPVSFHITGTLDATSSPWSSRTLARASTGKPGTGTSSAPANSRMPGFSGWGRQSPEMAHARMRVTCAGVTPGKSAPASQTPRELSPTRAVITALHVLS